VARGVAASVVVGACLALLLAGCARCRPPGMGAASYHDPRMAPWKARAGASYWFLAAGVLLHAVGIATGLAAPALPWLFSTATASAASVTWSPLEFVATAWSGARTAEVVPRTTAGAAVAYLSMVLLLPAFALAVSAMARCAAVALLGVAPPIMRVGPGMPALQGLAWAGALLFTLGAAINWEFFAAARKGLGEAAPGAGEALMGAAAALLLAAAAVYSLTAGCVLGALPGLGASRTLCCATEQQEDAVPPEAEKSGGGGGGGAAADAEAGAPQRFALRVRTPEAPAAPLAAVAPLAAAFEATARVAEKYVAADGAACGEKARAELRAAKGGLGPRARSDGDWALAASRVRAALALEGAARGRELLAGHLRRCVALAPALRAAQGALPGEAAEAVLTVVWAAPRLALALDPEAHLRRAGEALAGRYGVAPAALEGSAAVCADTRAALAGAGAEPPRAAAVARLAQLCAELGAPAPSAETALRLGWAGKRADGKKKKEVKLAI